MKVDNGPMDDHFPSTKQVEHSTPILVPWSVDSTTSVLNTDNKSGLFCRDAVTR